MLDAKLVTPSGMALSQAFEVLANEGNEMEHAYSKHPNGLRIFYILLQLAYCITQLILHGSLIKSLCRTFGSAKNFARRLDESMRNHLSHRNLTMPGQIRFSVLADRLSQQPP